MPDDRRALGAWGERLAEEHLRALGFRILARNLRVGRNELDLVAIERQTLCFVEVRTRRSTRFGTPQESVNRKKQRHLVRAAQEALRSQRWPRHGGVRFDVVAVDAAVEPPRLELIRNAFSA